MPELPAVDELFSENEWGFVLLIEARSATETVFDVHHEYHLFHTRNRAQLEYVTEGGFVTQAYGLLLPDGRRFVSFCRKPSRYADFWGEFGKQYCAESGRSWGEFRNHVLTISDGSSFPESKLQVIETNPVGKRRSDKPPRTPEQELATARANAALIASLDTQITDRSKRDWLRSFHLSFANKALGKLVAEGALDVAGILSDPALDPIKNLPEFREMIASLRREAGEVEL
jgi:hypothetical protein